LKVGEIPGISPLLIEFVLLITIWTSINSTKAKLIVSNLTGGSCYAFRVAGIGANPTIVNSDIVTSYVL
jgi:hypothetical protein